ncbi:hypothetical protein LZD49_19710 [Dyadobacter sp. CY261]|uniref:hypothetical protein n=1 Tax=Dyadobacter sp. CY261 TaxID=2907203 RepID=UPI001F1E92B1|nr:hypothetical protein [Dyadobacter sp. CY261]MCF0072717.1 hypothetical protein [Dyadobacter sp. CY261]
MDDQALDIEEFQDKIPESTYSVVENKKIHSYTLNYYKHYLKIKFGDGSAMPRNPTVINISTNEALPNPRQADQVEQKETFGIIDFKTGFLWVSNYKKRNALLEFLRQNFRGKKILSKDVYSEEKFIQAIKKLDNIKLSATPNLFTQSNTLSGVLSDEINGYEATTAILSFQYHDKFVGRNLTEKIKSIFNNRLNFTGIVISGRDEKDLGMLFNPEGFFRKIEFKAAIDENEMFLADELFRQVITKIENENT